MPARDSHHEGDPRGVGRDRGARRLIQTARDSVRIESIADHTDLVPTIAAWHWAEWGHTDPGGSLDAWTAGLRARTRRDAIPTILVAFVGDTPAGSVALVEHDMSIWRQYSPWLSGMYVVAEQRGHGIGTALLAACEAKAASLGVQTLYLYTHSAEPFYRRYGWIVLAHDLYGGETVAIMSKALGGPTRTAGDSP